MAPHDCPFFRIGRGSNARKRLNAPRFDLWDLGIVPRPAVTPALLRIPAVQQELKITEAQKKEQAAIQERRFQKIQQARRDTKTCAKFRPHATTS